MKDWPDQRVDIPVDRITDVLIAGVVLALIAVPLVLSYLLDAS